MLLLFCEFKSFVCPDVKTKPVYCDLNADLNSITKKATFYKFGESYKATKPMPPCNTY